MRQECQLRDFVFEVILPMFPGTEAYEVVDDFPDESLVKKLPDAKELYLSDGKKHQAIALKRSSAFSIGETALVRALLESFLLVQNDAPTMLKELRHTIVRRAISRHLARKGNLEQQKTVSALLEYFIDLSTQTYEGLRITSGVVIENFIDETKPEDALNLLELVDEDFIKVLSDGTETWWKVDARGKLMSFGFPEKVEQTLRDDNYSAHYPVDYASFAKECIDGRIGLALNSLGEILIFAGGKLQFARRRGDWLHFSHLALITILKEYTKNEGLAHAVYETCLDVSFNRRGACMGLLSHSEEASRSQMARFVSIDDWLSTPANAKSRVASSIICGRKFHDVERKFRAELAALDGAILFSEEGSVLTTGAILALPGRKRGHRGGRSAAAQMLGEIGLGVKVSEDGLIVGYNSKGELFRFG